MEIVISYFYTLYSFRFVLYPILIALVLIKYFYQIFKHSYKNGFLREKSLDISFISLAGLTLPPIVFMLFSQIPSLNYLNSTTYETSIITLLLLTFIYSKSNKLSFLKLLDFIFQETSFALFWLFILNFMVFPLPRTLLMSCLFLIGYLILLNSQKSSYNSLFFGLLRAKKTDEVTFVGGNAMLFLIYYSAVAMLNIFLIRGFNTYFFILSSVVSIYCFIKFISLSKAKKILWTLNLSFFKKKSLPKKDKILLKRLID